ncbi:MAG TPA: peptide deformylase [Chlamydiales bacterium]|nr:peptide deformylase [Chlamydiales bacterium]
MTLLLPPTDPLLNQRADEVCACHIQSDEIQSIIDQMIDFAYGNTKDRSKSILVGLAAPQIGIQKRIILVDTAATGVFTKDSSPPPPQIDAYIDPEIVWKSDEIALWREGCYSTSRICGIVPRAKKIVVRSYDRNGDVSTQEFEGYTARIFQHEIDHLDGIRFPDYVQNEEHLHWVEEKEMPEYRIHWANWEKTCPREKWLEMKNGSTR